MTEPRSRDDEAALAIGRLVRTAASMEYLVSVLAAVLIDSDRASLVVFGQVWTSTSNTVRAIARQSLREAEDDGVEGRLVDVPHWQSLLDCLGRLDALMRLRNDVVHAVWIKGLTGPNVTTETLGSLRVKRWRTEEEHHWTLDELIAIDEQLEAERSIVINAVGWEMQH